MSEKNTEYVSEGLGRMLQQFEGSLKLRELASAFLSQCQALEDAIHPLLAERGIDNMTGDRLDGLGSIVGLNRGGRADADYRLAIKAELLILQSKGTAEEIIAIAQALILMVTPDYEFIEYFPKTVYIRPVGHVFEGTPSGIANSIRRAVAAATELLFVFASSDPGIWYYGLDGVPGGDTIISFNTETVGSITTVWVGEKNAGYVNRRTPLLALQNGDKIRMYSSINEYIEVTVTSSVDSGTYHTVTVSGATTTPKFDWPTVTDAVRVTFPLDVSESTLFQFSSQGAVSETDSTQGYSGLLQDTGGYLTGAT